MWTIISAAEKALKAAGASDLDLLAYLGEITLAPDIAATRRITERWVTVEQP